MFSQSTLQNLRSLTPGPHVSVFLPTATSGNSISDAATHLKNLVREAEKGLRENGVTASDAEALLAPVNSLVTDRLYWQHQAAGLALFVSGHGLVEVSVNHTLTPQVVVGDHPDVLPLLPGLTPDAPYLLVCASESEVTVYSADATGLTPLDLEDIPDSVADVITDDDYENPVLASPPARPNTGTHNMSNSQVYGAAPPEWKAMVRRKFAGQLSSGIAKFQKNNNTPLVLIADDVLAGELSGPLGAVAIDTTHPTALSEAQRHEHSWRLVLPVLDSERRELLDTAGSRIAKNEKVLSDPDTIEHAAIEGRVETLLIAIDTPNAVVTRGLFATLATGGQVVWAGDAPTPFDTGVIALLRF